MNNKKIIFASVIIIIIIVGFYLGRSKVKQDKPALYSPTDEANQVKVVLPTEVPKSETMMSLDEIKEQMDIAKEATQENFLETEDISDESKPKQAQSDEQELMIRTKNWEYAGYAEMAGQISGKISDTGPNGVVHIVYQGTTLKDVVISELYPNKVELQYGEAKRVLNLVPISFSGTQKEKPIPLLPEEEFAAQQRYEEEYGQYMRQTAAAAGFVPPTPPSPEEIEKSIQKYMDTVYKENMERMKSYTPKPGEILPMPKSPEEEQKAREEFENKYGAYSE